MKITSQLNNIFDQYDQSENRVTNALLQTFSKNSGLLREFLSSAFELTLSKTSDIVISSQKEPLGIGDLEEDKERAEGIPDGWIVIDKKRAVVFETKIVRDAIRKEQLLAHLKRTKGYEERFLCVVTPDDDSPIKSFDIPGARVHWVSWRDVYGLVNRHKTSDSELAEFLRLQLKEYLAMAEDLVGFQGIDYPSGAFNQLEAKVIIKNLIKEIKTDVLKIFPRLTHERKNYSSETHPYTVHHRSVWSFLGADEEYTKDMHLTFWLTESHMGMGITVPNDARKRWGRLRSLFKEDAGFAEITDKLFVLRKALPNLCLEFVQRHYLGQKIDFIDGIIEFDLDTVRGNKDVKVKSNPLWLPVIRELIANKNGYNGQLMILTRFFHKARPDMKSAQFKDTVVRVANHFKGIYDLLAE